MGKVFRMHHVGCYPVLLLFHRSAKILDALAIDGFDFTVRGHDRNETGYPVKCRTCTSLAFPQRILGALAFLDVVGGPVPLSDLAVLVARSDTVDGEPAILSVGTPDALLRMPWLARGKGITPHFLAGRDVVGMRHDGPFRAARSLVGKTRVLFPGGVDEVAPGVCRIARHRDWDGIDLLPQLAPRLGELSLSLAQHILRTLALRQIEHEGGALVTALFT